MPRREPEVSQQVTLRLAGEMRWQCEAREREKKSNRQKLKIFLYEIFLESLKIFEIISIKYYIEFYFFFECLCFF